MRRMNNKVKSAIDQIDIPEELSKTSEQGLLMAKSDIKNHQASSYFKRLGVVFSILVAMGLMLVVTNQFTTRVTEPNHPVVEDGQVIIPRIELPENDTISDMIGLIVFNDRIYTQTTTQISGKDGQALLGEKLGRTSGSLDEWSGKEAYEEQFASTIGQTDVYSVRGYDQNFRIMTYSNNGEDVYIEFYENLNDIKLKSGQDLFGKLNLAGQVLSAKYRLFSEWDQGIEKYADVKDFNTLTNFVSALNDTTPHPRLPNDSVFDDLRNNQGFKELTIQLKDGSQIALTLYKPGYIYYGYMDAYFKMNQPIFSEMWEVMPNSN